MVEEFYHQLSETYDFPETEYLPKILERCLTKEEVGVKSSVEVTKVATILKELFSKGFIVYKRVDDKLRYGLINDLFSLFPSNKRVRTHMRARYGEEK